jgi:cytochrome c553
VPRAYGNSVVPANPSIAGQPAEYITLQLAHFKAGLRVNPVMQGMAATLQPDDMKAIGIYYSQQKPSGQAAKDPTLVAAGQKLFRGATPPRASPRAPRVTHRTARAVGKNYPRLAGQHADYTYAQLKAFKAGERGADKDGKDANGTIMVTGRRQDERRADEGRRRIRVRPPLGIAVSARPVTSARAWKANCEPTRRKMPTASVAALNVYPVKSCAGIGQEQVRVAPAGLVASTPSGAVGDREWMIVDRDGTFVTQREYPRLALIGTNLEGGALVLRAPGNAQLAVSSRMPRRHARGRGLEKSVCVRMTRATKPPRGCRRRSALRYVSSASIPRIGVCAIRTSPATRGRTRRSPMAIRCSSSRNPRSPISMRGSPPVARRHCR